MNINRYILFLFSILLCACSTYFNLEYDQNEIIPVIEESDLKVNKIISEYKYGIDSAMNEVLCYSEIEMKKGKPESLLGNFVSDLCLEQFSNEADICIMNNGGLRNILPKGNITKGDIYKLMPFENELVVLELTNDEFRELINYLILRNGEPFSGMEVKVFADLNYTYKFNNNFTFQNNKKLKILTSDYLANGGDDMFFFKKKTQKKLNIKLRDVIIKYCKLKQIINSKTDERLIFIKNEK